MKKPVFLVANGALHDDAAARLRAATAREAHHLVAVDGGGRHLLRLGIDPHFVTGDFDSLTSAERDLLARRGAQIVPTPDQDFTDLDKALSFARERLEPSRLRVFGATGGRLDHLYSVLSTLVRHGRHSDVRLVDEVGETFRVGEETVLEGEDLPGRTLSLMALGRVDGVAARGVRWPLEDASLAPGERDGTLNEIVDARVTLRVGGGDLVALLHHGTPAFTVGEVASAQDREGLIDLRWHVLRPGRPRSSARFDGDDAPSTVHLAARGAEGRVVGCATLIDARGMQLRGMAVDPAWQGRGVGAAIVARAQEMAAERGVELWCNARLSASGFYAACGWDPEGEIFEVPGIGPHVAMRWRRGGGA